MVKSGNITAIIGNGCAGAECIKALRQSGYTGTIHLFTDSKWPVYNPMLTTYYAAGKISIEQMFPYGKGDEFPREYQVDVHPASPVIALDAEKRLVVNQAGLEISCDKCLIASGASPVLPQIEGVNSDRVHVVRTVEDAVRLKGALEKNPRKALVIGASMVGIKIAELFYRAGIEVCLVDLADHIFPLMAHAECSRVIEDRLTRMSIKLRLGVCVEKLADIPGGIRAYFNPGRDTEEAELIVICIGMRANTAFIDGGQVEIKQGVLVDEHLETNVPGLFAAGDAAQGKNLLTGSQQIIGLWANARYQGRTAGRNMAGMTEVFPGNIPHNITHFLGMDFIGIGDVCEYDRMDLKYKGKQFRQLFWKNGRLSGVNLLDVCAEAGVLKNALARGIWESGSGSHHPLPVIQDIMIRKILAEVEKA